MINDVNILDVYPGSYFLAKVVETDLTKFMELPKSKTLWFRTGQSLLTNKYFITHVKSARTWETPKDLEITFVDYESVDPDVVPNFL